jgi:hypothetical protein
MGLEWKLQRRIALLHTTFSLTAQASPAASTDERELGARPDSLLTHVGTISLPRIM